MDDHAAQRLIVKLREFASNDLDEDERELLAVLLAPGIERAYGDDGDVRGFGMPGWSSGPVDAALVRALHAGGVRVVRGGDPSE